MTPATAPATTPAPVATRAKLSASAPGSLPPTLSALTVGVPAGFAIALADVQDAHVRFTLR